MASPAIYDNFEHLKREYVENAISLAESFTRQSEHYISSEGDAAAAKTARDHAQHFYAEAVQMLHLLRDRSECDEFARRLGTVRGALGLSEFVA